MTLEQTQPASSIEFRAVGSDDEAFLFAVYASARELELSLTGWDEPMRAAFLQHQFTAQRDHYLRVYPGAVHEIILVEGRPVGRRWVNRSADEIRILDLTVLTEKRGYGIGGNLLRDLQAEAARKRKRLSIYVEANNPSLTLFQRLGFVTVEEKGPHLLQVWEPPSDPAATIN